MTVPVFLLRGAPLALLCALGACGGQDKDADLAALDAQLTNNVADPAVRGAVEERLAVDPDLVSQSNRNTVRPSDRPLSGARPVHMGKAADAAAAKALAGGKLMPAPAPGAVGVGETPMTLGALAQQQEQQQKQGGTKNRRACGQARVSYDMGWAQRLPASFPLYPGARLTEAAGADNGPCAVRAVSFTTTAPVQDVLDFYYTMGRRAGFSGERQSDGATEVLGGTHGERAYYLTVEPVRGGGSAVDLIVNGG